MNAFLKYLFAPEQRDYSALQYGLADLHELERERSDRLVADMELTREETKKRWDRKMGVAA